MTEKEREKKKKAFLAEPVMWEWADRSVPGFERFIRCEGHGVGRAEVCGKDFIIAWDIYSLAEAFPGRGK